MSNESIFQHDAKPKMLDTPMDAIMQHGNPEMVRYADELSVCTNGGLSVMIAKNYIYGDSWKKRGGIGAFMMLARKWDRIEIQVRNHGYDAFKACNSDWEKSDNLLDDIRDLRNYLTLVEHEMRVQHGDFKRGTGDVQLSGATTNQSGGGDDSSGIRAAVPVRK